MAYVVQSTEGVRIFASREAAERWEARKRDRYIMDGCEIDPSPHYRGRIPVSGVQFYSDDISTPELIAAMMNQ